MNHSATSVFTIYNGRWNRTYCIQCTDGDCQAVFFLSLAPIQTNIHTQQIINFANVVRDSNCVCVRKQTPSSNKAEFRSGCSRKELPGRNWKYLTVLLILQAIPHTIQCSCYWCSSSVFGQLPEVQWDSSATHVVNTISHFCMTTFQLSDHILYSAP